MRRLDLQITVSFVTSTMHRTALRTFATKTKPYPSHRRRYPCIRYMGGVDWFRRAGWGVWPRLIRPDASAEELGFVEHDTPVSRLSYLDFWHRQQYQQLETLVAEYLEQKRSNRASGGGRAKSSPTLDDVANESKTGATASSTSTPVITRRTYYEYMLEARQRRHKESDTRKARKEEKLRWARWIHGWAASPGGSSPYTISATVAAGAHNAEYDMAPRSSFFRRQGSLATEEMLEEEERMADLANPNLEETHRDHYDLREGYGTKREWEKLQSQEKYNEHHRRQTLDCNEAEEAFRDFGIAAITGGRAAERASRMDHPSEMFRQF